MLEKIAQHITKFTHVSPAELKSMVSFFKVQSFKKKELLVTSGQICNYNYFVAKGCLRMFFTDDKGVEKTVQFAIENWWLTNYQSYNRKTPSQFSIQAVEASDVICLAYTQQQALFKQHPVAESYFRQIHETAHAAYQHKSMFYQDFSKEELFLHFNASFPQFVQRIPQYLLASYLGITPEYLSELRAKMVS